MERYNKEVTDFQPCETSHDFASLSAMFVLLSLLSMILLHVSIIVVMINVLHVYIIVIVTVLSLFLFYICMCCLIVVLGFCLDFNERLECNVLSVYVV
jgi:hypothetical protein